MSFLFGGSGSLTGQQAIYVNDGKNVLRLLRKVAEGKRYYYENGQAVAVDTSGDRPYASVR